MPPSLVSPFVAFTSKTPSPSSSIVMSYVPAPASATAMLAFPCLSSPYERAAAVGSFTIRRTLRPAIVPASLVA